MTTRRTVLMAAMAAIAAPALARAQDYPSRPIRIIVPFTGGSGSDASARYYAEKMAPILGQPIIVENKPGAEGAIGMMAAKNEPADGYTIVQGGISPSVVNAVMVEDLRYDPVVDFKPLLGYGRNMNVLLVPNDSPLKRFADLLARGRTQEQPLNVATFSTTLRLAVAWLEQLAHVRLTNIPYRGQAPAINDVMGGQVDMALVDLGGATPLLRSGKVRALAVTGSTRSPDFPDIPTVRESGLDDYVLYSWNGFFVRSETPEAVCAKLASAIRTVMTSREAIENFYRPKGTEAIPLDAARMRAMQKEEIERFRKIAAAIAAPQS